MDKRFWGVLGGLIVIAIILAIIFGGGGAGNSASNAKPSNNVEGQGASGVTLVEYGDFQCPACGEFYPTLEQVVSTFQKQITYQFRNYPLTSLHPNALAAARAGEAAALQAKFFQMYSKLYTQNVEYYQSNEKLATWISASDPTTYFDQYAKALGLDVAKFKQDFASSKVNDTIQADRAAGDKLNIQGTPSFYLDGKEINVQNLVDKKTQGPSFQAFAKIINTEIVKKGGQAVKLPASPPSQSTSTEPIQTKKN